MQPADNRQTAIPATPPPGWEREVPRYRVIRDVFPSPKPRFRTEPPFANILDSSEWQYAERDYKAGETVETQMWPHASFFPLNFSAKKVLEFFSSRQKSRLPRSPWADGRIRLDDGLSGDLPKLIAPKVAPINRDAWPDL